MNKNVSPFIISLDFELYWGIRDVRNINEYKANLAGVHFAIPQMLKVFKEHNIRATWAYVGFLDFENFSLLQKGLPQKLPNYTDSNLSPYKYLATLSNEEHADIKKLHFAPYLVDLIKKTPGQELATHTFSHYYTLEEGQSDIDFEADLLKHIEHAKQKGIELKSIVFPRNQVNQHYFQLLSKHNITAYRGSQNGWMYTSDSSKKYNSIFKRGLRFIDTFIPISSNYAPIEQIKNGLVNIPATRFLQPYSNRPSWLEKQKISRIKNEMTNAALSNKHYHLWWHPHNFGINIEQNIAQLIEIVDHYNTLKAKGLMISKTMNDIANEYH